MILLQHQKSLLFEAGFHLKNPATTPMPQAARNYVVETYGEQS